MVQCLPVTPAGCRQTLLYHLPHRGRALVIWGVAVLGAATISVTGVNADQVSRPNVVFIMADDMGYGDVRALNPDSRIPTPNLDRLAAEGMTFSDAHTPSAVCTPTRYGLLTGRYCWRSRLTRGVLDGYGEPLIEPERQTFAAFLQSQGYHTAVVGKWHLGLGWTREAPRQIQFDQPISDGPPQHGFDESYIIPASLDFPPYVYIRNGEVTAVPREVQPAQRFPAFLREGPIGPDLVMEECLHHLAGQATAYLAERAEHPDRPFMLYFPLTAPHKPVLAHPDFVDSTALGDYGDFVHQVDWTVGQVLQQLDRLGLTDNTLVFYTSDNGSFMYRYEDDRPDHVDDATIQAFRSDRHRANGPWRGTKADIWEAGHRVPFFARLPGVVAAGSRCERTICLTDVFATLADLVNAELPSESAPDSFSFLPLLQDDPGDYQRPPVIHHSAGGMFAIREGRWKLVAGNGSGGRQAPRGQPFERPFQLFDLRADPAESQDLIEARPEIAQRLEARLNAIRENEGR